MFSGARYQFLGTEVTKPQLPKVWKSRLFLSQETRRRQLARSWALQASREAKSGVKRLSARGAGAGIELPRALIAGVDQGASVFTASSSAELQNSLSGATVAVDRVRRGHGTEPRFE